MPKGQIYPKQFQRKFHGENLNRRDSVPVLFSKTGSFGGINKFHLYSISIISTHNITLASLFSLQNLTGGTNYSVSF